MSFLGTKADAKKYAEEADIQLDGLNPADTSPTHAGGSAAGAAPIGMEGPTQFTNERHRKAQKGNQREMRREFPAEGVSK